MKHMIAMIFALIVFGLPGAANANEIRLAVTTSFNNSGLSDYLLPAIKEDLGLNVQLLVVGTGQALTLGKAGDVDAVLVHSKTAEEAFVDSGFAVHRREIMFNDFVVVGPDDDPANISSSSNVVDAFERIKNTRAPFVSRGDDSGTHRKEHAIWDASGADPHTFETSWYRSTGSGMGAALNTASGLNAYLLVDRASWLNFSNRRSLRLLYSGDPVLFNQYAFLPINPNRHGHVKHALARDLEDWLTGEKGQALIGSYTIGGETVFTPNAVEK